MSVIIVVAVLAFGAIGFAMHKGYGVRAAIKWLGLSLTFEAQRQDKTAE